MSRGKVRTAGDQCADCGASGMKKNPRLPCHCVILSKCFDWEGESTMKTVQLHTFRFCLFNLMVYSRGLVWVSEAVVKPAAESVTYENTLT